MSEAYLMSMPVIVNCLGGEMIYILCSRLKAQKISLEKSIRVIKDIGNIIFNKKFQNDLYIHKKPYKHQEIKSIFESFAHSSIMRLNTTSMNKLFELMLMTLKLQILRSRYPEEIYQITLNHYLGILEILNSIENDDRSLIERIEEEMENFKKNYSKLSPYDYIILKSVILRFLQGKNVKVSIFIQDNLQDSNSIIYLPMKEESPPLVGKLGLVKNYSNGMEDFFELKLNNFYMENKNKNRMNNFNTELGKNMFGAEKLKIIGREKKKENKENEDEKKNQNNLYEDQNRNDEESLRQEASYNVVPIRQEISYSDTPNILESLNDKKKNEIKDSVFAHRNINRQLTDEEKKIISKGNQKDLILFSSMFASTEYDNDDIFQFDLFGMNNENITNKGKKDENYINIERTKNDIKNKMNKQFDNLNEQKKEDNEDDVDDLLDLMDKNI